jgi:hypothetical protein
VQCADFNWTKHANVLTIDDVSWAHKAVWAPAPVARNGKYYLYFAANDIQSNAELGGIGVAVADRPEGPHVDAIGRPLIGQFVNGAQPIDQDVFVDSDGQAYMYYRNAIGWKTYGGSWSSAGGSYRVSSSPGGKALLETNFADLGYDADVTIRLGNGDGGVVFRVAQPAIGVDSYRGYYAGISGSGRVLPAMPVAQTECAPTARYRQPRLVNLD